MYTALVYCSQVTFQTAHGQLLDLITAPIGEVDLSKYTLDNYLRIVTYKTAFYTFYLPVACGMLLAGISDDVAYKTAEPILVEMGQYFQVINAVRAHSCLQARLISSHAAVPSLLVAKSARAWVGSSRRLCRLHHGPFLHALAYVSCITEQLTHWLLSCSCIWHRAPIALPMHTRH